MADDDRTPMSKDAVHRRRLRGRRRARTVELARQATPRWQRAAFRLGRAGRAAHASCAARTRRPATQLEDGGLRVTTTLDLDLQKIAEKWVKVATIVAAPRATRRAAGEGARLRRIPGLDAQPREQGRPQRRPRRPRLPDRRAHRLRRLGRVLRDARAARSSSRSTTSSARASASRDRRSSRSTTRSGIDDGTFTAGDMLMDVGDRLRRRLHPDRRRQPRARSGPRRGPPSSSR